MLFDSFGCQNYYSYLNDFENKVFGTDFQYKLDDIRHWLLSESFFCSAIITFIDSEPVVQSACSMLIVTEDSATRLIQGYIKEHELIPAGTNPNEQTVLYYSSLIINDPNHAKLLLRSVHRDILNFKSKRCISLNWAFSIPTVIKAREHLQQAGFLTIKNQLYLGKYEFMRVNKQIAHGKYWTILLN